VRIRVPNIEAGKSNGEHSGCAVSISSSELSDGESNAQHEKRVERLLSTQMRCPRRVSECHTIADLRVLAHSRLPYPIFHYLDGGAETESSLRRNTASFDSDQIIQRCLVDVSKVDLATRVFGRPLQWPVMCSPTGASRFFHSDGELAVARAAERTDTVYALSTMSTVSLEKVAAVGNGMKIFQLYIFKKRDITLELIERCKKAGYAALCLTVDSAVPGKRERDLRTGWGIPIRISTRTLGHFIRRPRWLLSTAKGRSFSLENFAARTGTSGIAAQSRYVAEELDASVTWKDVSQIIELWRGPFALKGIMSVDDAKRAADVGATALFVSNHGGRQLDGAAAPYEVLPSIVRAVGEKVDVILDGGVRRGVHVLKALARGAKACSIGRPYLYGLSAGGEEGVARALTILRTELVRSMQLSGYARVKDLDDSLLAPR
jgi:L-lactate dehydrogenase (cytochrome)